MQESVHICYHALLSRVCYDGRQIVFLGGQFSLRVKSQLDCCSHQQWGTGNHALLGHIWETDFNSNWSPIFYWHQKHCSWCCQGLVFVSAWVADTFLCSKFLSPFHQFQPKRPGGDWKLGWREWAVNNLLKTLRSANSVTCRGPKFFDVCVFPSSGVGLLGYCVGVIVDSFMCRVLGSRPGVFLFLDFSHVYCVTPCRDELEVTVTPEGLGRRLGVWHVIMSRCGSTGFF